MSRHRIQRLLVVAAVLAAAPVLTGCYSTGPTEVGVRTTKFAIFGKAGVKEEYYAPGATYVFLPFMTDWHKFDIKLQNLEMIADPRRGDRRYKDDLRFKTKDGNDVRVNVTVAWRIDPKKAPYLLKFVGLSTPQVKERLVRPVCRTLVRDVLNQLSSEDFYVAGKRFAKADEARRQLRKRLGPEGVLVEQVILGMHRFSQAYEGVIKAKKLAEQKAEELKSAAMAKRQAAKRNLEQAEGLVRQNVVRAKGALAQRKHRADAYFYQRKLDAQATLIEAKAVARAIRERNKALRGAGGTTLVKIRMAEALAGKKIVFLPSGGASGVAVQTVNLNKLISAVLGASRK